MASVRPLRPVLFPEKEAPDHPDLSWLDRRDPTRASQWEESRRYRVDDESLAALDVALRLGDPLLVTGEPGTGKTQLAYYAAHRLGLGEPLHVQVRSTSRAQDLKYTFDTIAYFRSVYEGRLLAGELPIPGTVPGPPPLGVDATLPPRLTGLPDKRPFIAEGPLWEALRSDRPRVLLIDEIDKAPRDFPNDLLHELDQMEFKVHELPRDHEDHAVRLREPRNRPLVLITSNSEHRLPEAFLRRCVYHHLELSRPRLREIAQHRRAELGEPSDTLIDVALDHLLALRDSYALDKRPSTHELLVWLKALARWSDVTVEELREMRPPDLPRLGLLLKRKEDLERVRGPGAGER